MWTAVLAAIGVAALLLARVLERVARRRSMQTALGPLLHTPPDVLYLRGFDTDRTLLRGGRGPRHAFHELMLPRMSDWLEDVVTWPLWSIGAVAAVTPPGAARQSTLGAARWLPLPEQEWREGVLHLMQRAKVIVLVLSRGHGVRWELGQVRSDVALAAKTIVVIPPRTMEVPKQLNRWKGRNERPSSGCRALAAYWDSHQFRLLWAAAHEDVDYEVAMEQALFRAGLLALPGGKTDLRL